ncbi:MAG: extracellular solute-binding protein [Oscillospiraceae bacterium]
MKKLVSTILAIAMMCPLMTACGDPKQTSTENTATYTTEGKENKLVPDENATGELSISFYGTDFEKQYDRDMGDSFNAAQKKFKELYPKVTLTIDRVSYDEDRKIYSEKLAAEVMSGNGPDLFWIQREMDISKMMNAGVFADMHDYFEKDISFNIKDYNEKVFFGGQPQGKQYIVPLNYAIPLLISTKTAIEKASFDVSKCNDYYSCLEQIHNLYEKNQKRTDLTEVISEFTTPLRFPAETGVEWIDFEEKTVEVNTPQMKQMMETYQAFYSLYKKPEMRSGGGAIFADRLKANSVILAEPFAGLGDVIQNCRNISTFDESVMFPLRNVNGKIEATPKECVAVGNNSKNKQNAYNFIKIMLSYENQQISLNSLPYFIPISDIAMKALLKKAMISEELDYGPDGIKKFAPLSQALIDQYTGYLAEIENVNYPNKANELLREEMMPYYEKKKSYEECIKNAQDKLEIYVSE